MIGRGRKPQSPWDFAPELSAALRSCRSHFTFAVLFSVFAHLLVFAYPIYMLQVMDRVISSRSVETLVVLGTGLALALSFQAIFYWLQNALLARASARVDRMMGERVCAALMERSFRRTESGALALRDLDTVRLYLCGQGALARMELPWAGLFVGALVSVDMVLGIVAAICMVGVGALAVANSLVTKGALAEANQAGNDAQRFIEANLRSAEAALPMGMLPGLLSRWRASRDRALVSQLKATNRGGVLSSLLSIGQVAAQGILLGTGVLRVIEANVPVGFAFMATILFSYAMRPVQALVQDWEARQRTEESLLRLNNLLREVPHRPRAMLLPRPAGVVTFVGATYSIPGNAKPILRSINLRIASGTAHGIVGPSGSGKSTLLKLLVGNLAPTYGNVRVDGADVMSWDRAEFGRYLGYLPQEVCLVSGSVADNIGRFGLFGETDVVAAAKLSGAHDVIVRLPNGYDTLVGEGGLPSQAGSAN
ncbi:ATP-binding cassette domain-containing protein [Oleomonas cavernae]|uniref:ATP-binding cassette domain-containing protein n=1 Tax=Oleomonas cavernae TaxID=2320859 RepID=A0A418W8W6_9PROT|nr:ATP-binding cassette domain-containing protein [Oleomonas cavernae]RJF86442.1 ATP-binding cassette domain-containing protein [Oleomonas cavernae]